MEKRISYYLGQNGYLKMLTNLSEVTIFFKKENGFVSIVEVIDMDINPYMTEDILYEITQKTQWRFMDQGYTELHHLVLVLTKQPERALPLGEREWFFWIIDSKRRKLLIPEGKAEDFYGMKEQLTQWMQEEFDSESAQEASVYQANGRRIKSLKEQPLVNQGIFLLNVLVFTFCTLSGEVLYNDGRLSLAEVLSGQWYRIFTSMFLHGDMAHLIGNMITLFYLGNIVEKELGHIKYFILYFLSGTLGACASLWMQAQELAAGKQVVGSIGASGAIFGMLGGLLWILIRNKGRLREMTLVRALFFVCYTLYGGLMSENVDNAAHFGGLAAGFLLGIVLYWKKKKPEGREECR